MTLYHISDQKFDDLRARHFHKGASTGAFLKTFVKMGYGNKERAIEYTKEINFFFGKPTLNDINLLMDAGFKQWQMKEIYVYEVDSSHIKDSYSKVISTPEESEYINKYWVDNGDNPNFSQKLTEHLASHELGTRSKLAKIKNDSRVRIWGDMVRWFKYNKRFGSKLQYATCIPHVSVGTTGPIEYDKVERLK